VDISQWNPESEDNPSAVRALANWASKRGQAAPFRAAVAGAGVKGGCNPADSDYTGREERAAGW
jgi:hypothetical protein